MIIDRKKHAFDNCPTCKGLCLVLAVNIEEYADWAHRESCRNMIWWLEHEKLGACVTEAERMYAYKTDIGLCK